jgi:hypothetical protein
MHDATRGRGPIDQFIDAIEVTAAGFLAVVTLLTFVSVLLRYFFAWAIPDSYDFTRLLLGIVIFWGIAGLGKADDGYFLRAGNLGCHGRFHLDVRVQGDRYARR